jgi:hypothetical protein
MKSIYEILNAGTLGGSRLSAFYFPIIIALITYSHHKLSILTVGLGLFSDPKGIILVKIEHFGKNLEI